MPAAGITPPPPASCKPVLLSTSARPGQTVLLGGVPAGIADEGLTPTVRDPQSGRSAPTAARRLSGGNLSVLVPLHPTANRQGGTAELTVGPASAGCGAVPLAIAPLPAAPGTTAQMASELQGALRELAQNLGVPADALKGDVSLLPRPLLPLAVAQGILDHPANPNSPARMLLGTAPILNGRPVDLELLDALLASSGAADALWSWTDALRAVATAPLADAARRASAARGANPGGMGVRGIGESPAAGRLTQVFPREP